MPRGPRGEKRPVGMIGNAVKVLWIATGEETEEGPGPGEPTIAALAGSRETGVRVDPPGSPSR